MLSAAFFLLLITATTLLIGTMFDKSSFCLPLSHMINPKVFFKLASASERCSLVFDNVNGRTTIIVGI